MTLLGEWGFLDNLEDTSGNGRHASANFTPNYIDGPTPGTRAIRFSGLGQTIDYGRTGLEPVLADGGIVTMAWVKLFANHSNYTAIFHKTRALDSTRHAISIASNTVFWLARWRDQLVFRESGTLFADFGWHHIANIDATDRYAWFLDGALVQSAARSGTNPVSWEDFPWKSGYVSTMTGHDSDPNVAFTGVRAFSGTMTDLEIATWMNTDIVPNERSGKVKIWNGSSWDSHPVKIWNGTSWETRPIKGFNGTDWVTAK
ncbi:MAG TPA: hypothetical protein VFP47_08210 [Pyrinomonadaceae bacterium]|nr:hypothetical protein [Pyrinomonadaceae bacterium]